MSDFRPMERGSFDDDTNRREICLVTIQDPKSATLFPPPPQGSKLWISAVAPSVTGPTTHDPSPKFTLTS